jgi:hypothetical protein
MVLLSVVLDPIAARRDLARNVNNSVRRLRASSTCRGRVLAIKDAYIQFIIVPYSGICLIASCICMGELIGNADPKSDLNLIVGRVL